MSQMRPEDIIMMIKKMLARLLGKSDGRFRNWSKMRRASIVEALRQYFRQLDIDIEKNNFAKRLIDMWSNIESALLVETLSELSKLALATSDMKLPLEDLEDEVS